MKKHLLYRAILGFSPFFSLISAPLGNPAAPALLEEGLWISDCSWSNVQVSFTQDFLLEKKLKPRRGSSQGLSIHRAKLRGHAEIGEFTWSIRERLNIEVELGSGQFRWNWIQKEELLQGKSDNGFLWNGSGKLIVLEVKDTSLAVTGGAGGVNWMKGRVHLRGAVSEGWLKLRYWQVGPALTQKMGVFAPYIGCFVNQTRFQTSEMETGSARLESQVAVGPFLGCTITRGSRLFVNVEWRGFAEQAVALSGRLRF